MKAFGKYIDGLLVLILGGIVHTGQVILTGSIFKKSSKTFRSRQMMRLY